MDHALSFALILIFLFHRLLFRLFFSKIEFTTYQYGRSPKFSSPCVVCTSLDRQERVSNIIEDSQSAIQVVQEKYGLRAISIATLNGFAIKAYRTQYGRVV